MMYNDDKKQSEVEKTLIAYKNNGQIKQRRELTSFKTVIIKYKPMRDFNIIL